MLVGKFANCNLKSDSKIRDFRNSLICHFQEITRNKGFCNLNYTKVTIGPLLLHFSLIVGHHGVLGLRLCQIYDDFCAYHIKFEIKYGKVENSPIFHFSTLCQ